jgi:hypothetical protein
MMLAVPFLLASRWNPFYWESAPILALILSALVLRIVLPAKASRQIHLLRELLLVIPAALFYFLVRGLVNARGSDAEAHAQRLIDLEIRLGIYRELELQAAIIDSPMLVNIVNWIYIWGHWPLITVIVIWMVIRHRGQFPLYRNAFLISGAIGMIIFAAYPVAPPRLMPDLLFIDTVTERSNSYRLFQPPALTNPYAALPSLHFGWNLLMGIAVFRQARAPWLKGLAVIMPCAMFASIVLTGNHYILDGIAGGVIVGFALFLAAIVPRALATVASIRGPGGAVASAPPS